MTNFQFLLKERN